MEGFLVTLQSPCLEPTAGVVPLGGQGVPIDSTDYKPPSNLVKLVVPSSFQILDQKRLACSFSSFQVPSWFACIGMCLVISQPSVKICLLAATGPATGREAHFLSGGGSSSSSNPLHSFRDLAGIDRS